MRRRRLIASASVLLMIGLITLPGCNVDKKTLLSSLRGGGEAGTYYGLKKWAEKDNASANACAQALNDNIKNIMPALSGNTSNLISSEIQILINTEMFKNVNPDVKDAIVAASIVLDAVLPIPDPNTKLTSDQIEYIKAFLTGVSNGCDQFQGKSKAPFPSVWLK